MNSIKILVKSLDKLYPFSDLELPPRLPGLDEDYEIERDGESAHQDQNDNNQHVNSKQDKPPVASTSVLDVLLFLPNYLIIKPVIFIWLLFTYPFAYTFEQLGITKSYPTDPKEPYDDEKKQLDEAIRTSTDNQPARTLTFAQDPEKSRTRIAEYDDNTELLKQEKLIANTIKSPSSSSKYIIPPPQRLYPLSRNPHKKRRKTLILDLDETLIHSLSRGSPRSFNSSSSSAPKVIEIKLHNMASLYYVHKRPFCDYFLKEISKWFELQIFTASVKEYADPIIDWLENEIIDHRKAHEAERKSGYSGAQSQPPKIFTKRYYRADCTFRQGVGYIKDLSKFFPKDDDLKNVVILDNSPVSYALHEDNAVMIEGWINDQSDRDLLNLLPMLHSLSLCIDVRYILGLRNGEKVFEN